MPPITVRVLNNLPGLQTVIQDKNVRKNNKSILIAAVTQLRARRWNHGCLVSAYKTINCEAESNFLVALNTSSYMDEMKQTLRNYKQQLNNARQRVRREGNASHFMRDTGPLVGRIIFPEKVSKADYKAIKLPVREPEVCRQGLDQYSGKTPLFFYISATPWPPVNIHERIRTDIINTMKKAGYHPYEEGMCYGIAWTVLLACVRSGGQAYMERMQYLKQMNNPPLPGIHDTYQVYPFFDAVTLGMANYRNMSGYEKGIGYPGRQEVAFPGKVIGSHEPEYQVPVVKYAFIAECTPETFIRFLLQTRENNKGIPFGVMINYTDHVTSIGFDGNRWLAADHDSHYYTENTDLLYTFLRGQNNYTKGDKMIASIEMVVGNGHFLNINGNDLVVNAKKSMSVSLALHLALQYGDVNTTIDCITVIGQQAHTPEILLELLACKDAEGTPGFCMPLQNGHPGAITAFIQTSAAVIAWFPMPEEGKAKLMYELLVSKGANGTPGFFITLRNGHSDAITSFIYTSAAVIAELSLPERRKAELLYRLLASKNADGIPGFSVTLYHGHLDAITSFIQASAAVIATLPLLEVEKAELLCGLLASKRSDGTPVFFYDFAEWVF